ncbi:MAG: MFS transporter [Chloroflexota bacterium]
MSERSLWRDRDFRLVLGGQSVSALGDAITMTALPLIVVALTGSGVAMGVVGVLQTLPNLLFGLPAGALADRWDRRRIIIGADLGRALLTALVPLSYLLGWDTMAVILLVVFPMACLQVLFMAAWTSMMPALVGRDQMARASGWTEATLSIAFIIGPAIAGVLVSVIGAPATLLLDAVSFTISAGAMALVHRRLRADRVDTHPHLLRDVQEGLRYLVRQPTLRVMVGFAGLVSIATAPLTTAAIFYLAVDRSAGADVVGIVLALYSVGYLLGALGAAKLAKARLGRVMLIANALSGLALIGFAVIEVPAVQGLLAIVGGLGQALWLVPYITLRSTITPDRLLGRVSATARMVSLGMQPVGLFIGGVALDAVGGGPTIIAIGLISLAISGVFAFSASLREARVPKAPDLVPAAA